MKCPLCNGTGEVSDRRGHAELLIEHYYRSRARGSKTTLKDIADQSGFNYDYLRQVKARYDAAGGWGSKKKSLTI